MNFYLLAILAFCVFIAIVYLRSSEQQRMIYIQKYVRDVVSGTLSFAKFKENADELLKKNKTSLALIRLDMEPFHYIVTAHGRETAENILRIMGTELNRRIAKGYLVTRYAGAKFFCLVPFSDRDTNNLWFDGLATAVESEVKRICNINIKLQGALYGLRPEDSLEDAIVQAVANRNDKYACKEYHRLFFINDLKSDNNFNSLAADVSRGWKNDEFTVYFQPQYNIYTNEIVGAEALLRWEHPTRGIILPEVILPIFENSDYSSKAEKFIFEKICKFLSLRLALGLQVFPVSCNFSFEQFQDENFIDTLIEIADKNNVPHKLLVIELSEKWLSDDSDFAALKISELKSRGFKVAIDNFGAGYLSLRLLNDVNVDILKIDKSVLESCDSDKSVKIFKGIAAIIKELNIIMMCEGVETEAHVAIMKNVGCSIAQGFYYCQPLQEKQLECLLKVSRIEMVNTERRSINAYGREAKLPSYNDLGDLFPQMYDFAMEVDLKNGHYALMAFNPTGNVFVPFTGDYKTDYNHFVREFVYNEDVEIFKSILDFDIISANYDLPYKRSNTACRFIDADGIVQWYELRRYYWFGRNRALLTVKNINDAHK